MSSNKKPKTNDNSAEMEAYGKIKEYVLACPHVPADHPAIQAALKAVTAEEERRLRDAKLQQKFSQSASEIAAAESTDTDLEVIEHEESPAMNSLPNNSPTNESGEEDDWHEVPAAVATMETTACLGEALAQATVQSLSHHRVSVREPWQALVLAVHGALRSDSLEFKCTGKEEAVVSGGFAPPVRELPATQFLPTSVWNKTGNVALRYRKPGTGSVVLTAESEGEGREASCSFTFGKSGDAPGPLKVTIADHINLDSWARAATGGKSVAPSLHYKALSSFLTAFCQRFDVGGISDTDETMVAESLPYVDRSILNATLAQSQASTMARLPTTVPPHYRLPMEPWMREQQQPPTIESAFGLSVPPVPGDFAGDLVPGGLQVDPLHGGSGSLMGPDHPMFQTGGVHGMQPRFDPFGPLQPDDRGTGRGRPNNDHMRPPSNLNNNMFM
jgi:hypothetical protein